PDKYPRPPFRAPARSSLQMFRLSYQSGNLNSLPILPFYPAHCKRKEKIYANIYTPGQLLSLCDVLFLVVGQSISIIKRALYRFGMKFSVVVCCLNIKKKLYIA
ncbi:MAG: hypothetical protein IJX33_08510, partial [Akkermansia sp.]|nr:hypothetical protein [Akkermansia sp.]